MIRLRLGFLAEFAAFGQGKMLTAVNIFDSSYQATNPSSPPMCIVLRIEGSSDEPADHGLKFELRDDDGELIADVTGPVSFSGDLGAGHGVGVIVIKRMGPIEVDDYGHYEWVLFIDGQRLGELPLHILEPTPARTA